MEPRVLVIGAGLAGSDAAMFLAERGIKVVLVECKSFKPTEAQKLKTCAELVCTNSLKSKAPDSAHGVLKYEMDKLGSIVLRKGNEHSVPAGDALAVDREQFSAAVSEALRAHENIEFIEKEASDPLAMQEEFNCQYTIVATGPLTSKNLETWILEKLSKDDFYFYDAIAPVVDAESLDYSKLYYKDRHKEVSEEEGVEADYLNAPLNKEQYELFVKELQMAQKVPAQNFEDYKFFESCLPIDIMAERGIDTARFSCMKPIGLEMADGKRPYACVQLRRENLLGSAFNMVGFQTRLTYKEQVRVFRMIPGFEEASFIHLGSVHRNTFLHAKKLLNFDMSSKEFPSVHFAGQITGVEGYTESASMGLYVAHQVFRKIKGLEPVEYPVATGIGALVNYVMTADRPSPSNINFGLLPSVELTKEQRRDRKNRKKVKKALAAQVAREVADVFFKENEV
ncbi:methylenetetrahydrofolate--tRNA-(uracil(54)-C(5))-methyltransferase (FADH(2)-oxidizing) TrmFO [Halobacteriovorax sp. GB3]|uniref:methylenetetrahydrofolate--tRNA-(uracil(54)- C(5))-methyltransferase (FADH(2)-oxidizing) TrmFO n=1 Tax=Halobacteriovorax sp. GB3 TaxID=2719615 RepID=UPI00235F51F2|nr:methylenetetrahydrofolate--tRNA-(uracil(54)-C(5))-methyltransferase (FADH(2)-oxidizing) TrmFO [Halobacteriovorax sp. GB3]MDD0853486.1 methylenetetrahydrofolate--tRNA-(uracil(54)-C(5))-methyltransferase (FADH(2)-oxidizing) TrmFO [Halobacteriovorax sp. GB3]